MDPSTFEPGQDAYAHRADETVLDLGTLSPQVRQQVLDRFLSKDFGAWADTLARIGNCAHPVRLQGTTPDRIDRSTGEVLSSFSSADQLVFATLTAPSFGRVHTSGRSHRPDDDPGADRRSGGRLSRQVRDQDRR